MIRLACSSCQKTLTGGAAWRRVAIGYTIALLILFTTDASVAESPEAKQEPPITKGPPAIKTDFPITGEEQLVVQLINEFRAAEQARPLKVVRRLFDGARAEADMARKGQQRNEQYGYRNMIRLMAPARNVTPRQIVDQLTDPRSKITRVQIADDSKEDIGVGVTSANGVTYYVIIMGGDPR